MILKVLWHERKKNECHIREKREQWVKMRSQNKWDFLSDPCGTLTGESKFWLNENAGFSHKTTVAGVKHMDQPAKFRAH